ncbi:major facilitator superfamily transporter [Apodospora peruviana]|uniref:Major facilitator superfamily transporter n=1 Tax=Apodospora peruviana TaxID=516989 RepID=A0AAE0HT24_9PEZI|nr:major facilitator superfamily transporter [Apodospora peruviana]
MAASSSTSPETAFVSNNNRDENDDDLPPPTAAIPTTAGAGGGASSSSRRRSPGSGFSSSEEDEVDDDDDYESSDIDPNELDLMLSRSVQSTGGFLEPESVEHSMLRNIRRHQLQHGGRGSRRSSVATSDRQRRRSSAAASSKRQPFPDEETPLLPAVPSPTTNGASPSSEGGPVLTVVDSKKTTTNSVSSSIDVAVANNSPYLNGVSPARFWVLFLGIMATYFVACFDSTIMASSHPVITSYFGSSNSASWLSTAFLLTSTSFQPLLGGLSDAIGRKRPYMATMAIFLVATLWCALAQSMTSFILARAVCGIGAGGMMTLGSIMISDLVPIEIRGAYQSYINITFGVGAMLGAGLGGAMADYLGWRWEFGVQVPLLAASLLVAVTTIPSDLGLEGRPKLAFRDAMRTFDFKGSFLMSTSVTFLILGLSLGGNVIPWTHTFVISSLAAFAVCFPLFLYVETIAIKPIMPIHLVRLSPHRNLIFSNAIAAFLNNAILFNVPLFFQGVLLTSATASGLRLIVCSAVASTTGTITGFAITYTRRLKWPLVTGTILIFLGTICLSSMQRGWPTFLYLASLVPSSAGNGFQFPGTFMAILVVAEQRQQAVVTSTLILWRSLGMVLGVACSSLVVQNALWYYLQLYVSGEGNEKDQIIERVRGSVEAIRDLEPLYREQVVQSYEAALRVTFLCCSVLALVSVCLIMPVRLPRLGSRK